MKAYLRPIKFVYVATFLLTNLIGGQYTTEASTKTHSEITQSLSNNKSNKQDNLNQQNKSRPAPPATGTPKGNSTPTATRPQAMCKEKDKPLTAINANNSKDFTTSKFPTFWFYVPYNSQEIKSLKFILNNKKATKTIYKTSVKLLDNPGVIKIKIPEEKEYSLEVGETYRWRLNLQCKPNTEQDPDQVVKGWVRIEPANSKEETWYDYINNLAELYFSNQQNPEFNHHWNVLLKAIGKEWVIQEKFVSSEQIKEEE